MTAPVRYREHLAAPRRIRLAGGVLLVLDVLLLGATLVRPDPDGSGAAMVVLLLGAVVLVPGAALLALRIRIVVLQDEVRLALRPYWRVRLRIRDLRSGVLTTSPEAWGGIGLRRGRRPDGRRYRALLFDAGPAVMLHDTSSDTTYVVRSASADLLLELLRSHPHPRASDRVTGAAAARGSTTSPRYPATLRQLRAAVPLDGEAATVQSELLRAASNLEDEARRNGNTNWGDRHRRQLAFLRERLADGTPVGLPTQVAADLEAIGRPGIPATDPAVWARIADATCAWAVAHPDPLPTVPAPATPDGPGRTARTAGLLDAAAAWLGGAVPTHDLVLAAAEVLPEIDDDRLVVPIAILPFDVVRADLEPLVRDLLEGMRQPDRIDGVPSPGSTLARLCREHLAGRLPGGRILSWASSAGSDVADPFLVLAWERDDGMDDSELEHRLRDECAAFLLSRPAASG